MLPTRELDDAQEQAAPVAAVEIVFHGETDGTLIVRICGDVLPMLAANMLGQDEAPDERLQRDALGEIANIICGNVLPTLAGPHAAFRLDAPKPVPLGGAAAAFPPHASTSVQVGLDGGRADIWLVVTDRVAA